MLPNASDWTQFYEQVKRKTGLDLTLYKPQQLQRRILAMAELRDTNNLADFWQSLAKDPQGVAWFLDKLAINTSELYRNPEKWVEMREKILPELLKGKRSIKAWSAGCSIGAEAYTLASILESKFPGNHSILCSDIDQAAMDQAKSGLYSTGEMKCVPPDIVANYFEKSGEKFQVKQNLRKYVKFQTQNLLKDKFDSGFDLIMCRNVVIYFTDEAKAELYQRFCDALAPNGILFVGCTERIFNAQNLGYNSILPFYYQKSISGETKWRNAS